jgi:hypothetical protein
MAFLYSEKVVVVICCLSDLYSVLFIPDLFNNVYFVN